MKHTKSSKQHFLGIVWQTKPGWRLRTFHVVHKLNELFTSDNKTSDEYPGINKRTHSDQQPVCRVLLNGLWKRHSFIVGIQTTVHLVFKKNSCIKTWRFVWWAWVDIYMCEHVCVCVCARTHTRVCQCKHFLYFHILQIQISLSDWFHGLCF